MKKKKKAMLPKKGKLFMTGWSCLKIFFFLKTEFERYILDFHLGVTQHEMTQYMSLILTEKRGIENRIIIIEAYKSSVLKTEMCWGSVKKWNLFLRLERSPRFLLTFDLLGSGLCLWDNVSPVERCVNITYKQMQKSILTPLDQLSMSMINMLLVCFQPKRYCRGKHGFSSRPDHSGSIRVAVRCLFLSLLISLPSSEKPMRKWMKISRAGSDGKQRRGKVTNWLESTLIYLM